MPAKNKPVPPLDPALSKGEATRARLIEAAYGLFMQQGFHGTSMRQIAEAAGLAVGGIYNHFKDKEEIFAAVLDAYHPYHTILPAVQALPGDSVEAYVQAAGREIYAQVTDAERQLLPLLFVEMVEFQGRHVKAMVVKLIPAVLSLLERFSKMRGPLRRLPLPLIFRAFMALLIGLVVSDMLLKDIPFFKQLKINWLEGMVDIFLHGILKPEA